uniref:Triple QxxK/R motif-containing protein n=1 Tax=Xenopus tropicalis TaxID=8364 RepID=A0A803J9E6_XENTR
ISYNFNFSPRNSQKRRQDYKKNKPVLKATRLKAEAKKTAIGIKEVILITIAILVFLFAFYAFFFLNWTKTDFDEESSN